MVHPANPFNSTVAGRFELEVNKKAPVKHAEKIIIKASVPVVWKKLTDIKNWSDWNDIIDHAFLNEIPKPESSFYWKSNGMKIKSTFHTVVENKLLGWSGKTAGIHAIHNWSLEENDNGVIVCTQESMRGLLPLVFKSWMQKQLKKTVSSWLYFLKNACESDKP